jgi:hypothetical protein
MAPEADLDWSRLDVQAIVSNGGVATVSPDRAAACRSWLEGEGYEVLTWNLDGGFAAAIPIFSRMLRWQEQFGYELSVNAATWTPCGMDCARTSGMAEHVSSN